MILDFVFRFHGYKSFRFIKVKDKFPMKVIVKLEDMKKIILYLKEGITAISNQSNIEKRNFVRRTDGFSLINEILYFRESPEHIYRKVVADDDFITLEVVLDQLHKPDHKGMKAMYMRSKNMYAGFKRERINTYVNNCMVCKLHQPLPRVSSIMPITTNKPWERIQIDCVDLRNYANDNDGFGWIVNIIDCYSKYLYSFYYKNKSADNILKSLKNIFSLEGSPEILQSDNGKEFVNTTITDFLVSKNVQFVRGRPRHPQNQGQVERVNQTLTRKIAKALSNSVQKRWIDIHQSIVFEYNTTWHRAINLSPMQAFRGRIGINNLIIPDNNESYSEVSELVANLTFEEEYPSDEHLTLLPPYNNTVNDIQSVNPIYVNKYVDKMKKDADVHYNAITFNPGEHVIVSKSFDTNQNTKKTKMGTFYEEGRWNILSRVSTDAFKIEKEDDSNTTMVVSKNRLKKI